MTSVFRSPFAAQRPHHVLPSCVLKVPSLPSPKFRLAPHQKSVGCGQIASCSTEMDGSPNRGELRSNLSRATEERAKGSKNKNQKKEKTILPKNLNPHRSLPPSQIASARWRAVWDGLFHRPAVPFPPASTAFHRWDGFGFSERESPSICA